MNVNGQSLTGDTYAACSTITLVATTDGERALLGAIARITVQGGHVEAKDWNGVGVRHYFGDRPDVVEETRS